MPTIGALHEGHLSLGEPLATLRIHSYISNFSTVRHSLSENDLTVVSIFVNPTQFAPHEDLASYPRTFDSDLRALQDFHVPSQRSTSAVFVPTVDVMYPSSVSQVVQDQKGTFVEVKGYGELMEGSARPTFFRGVATVVTKLFNAIQPSNAYFGQKDIQQAQLLRRMVTDLLMAYPSAETLHVLPTARSSVPEDGNLALSSRNAYLTPTERNFAPTLYRALKTGQEAWNSGKSKEDAVHAARRIIEDEATRAKDAGVDMRLDYVEMNDSWSFEVIDDSRKKGGDDEVVILSGAMWVGRTRLIDNILLGNSGKILY